MQQRDGWDGSTGTRGVSHVVGVVVLLAVTILLIAVVATYVTGFGDTLREPAPSFASTTSVDDRWDPNGQYLNVTHESGATIDTDDVRLDVIGAERVDGPPGGSRADADLKDDVIASQVGPELKATETIVVDRRAFTDGAGDLTGSKRVDLRDATVRIVYDHGPGDRTDVLYECAVATPDCEDTPA